MGAILWRGYVMALRKVLSDPLISSTKGSCGACDGESEKQGGGWFRCIVIYFKNIHTKQFNGAYIIFGIMRAFWQPPRKTKNRQKKLHEAVKRKRVGMGAWSFILVVDFAAERLEMSVFLLAQLGLHRLTV